MTIKKAYTCIVFSTITKQKLLSGLILVFCSYIIEMLAKQKLHIHTCIFITIDIKMANSFYKP